MYVVEEASIASWLVSVSTLYEIRRCMHVQSILKKMKQRASSAVNARGPNFSTFGVSRWTRYQQVQHQKNMREIL